jgi:FtsZ-interacting cell division protein ZipA
MSTLQLALIVAGIVLVAGVWIFNGWQERRVRRRIAEAFKPAGGAVDADRVEPTLATSDAMAGEPAQSAARAPGELPASPFAIPMDDVSVPVTDTEELEAAEAQAAYEVPPAVVQATSPARATGPQPDPDIESIAAFAPAQPVAAHHLGEALQARLGKPLRWFGRVRTEAPWQLVTPDAAERYAELCACLLLADRNGPVSQGQMGAFLRMAGELASSIDARVHVPDAGAEVQRAEALDKLCADLDVQIGLTLLKPEPGVVPGTKLRGVAEAAGFHLAPGGRFEHLQEDTGAVLYTLQNVHNDPFTVESLRISAVNGVVFLLDVPRVADPARAFDQMKLCAKRMARSLGAELVDDNRRLLDDAALAKIRAQVQAAAEALADVHIDPGSPRAAALFGA